MKTFKINYIGTSTWPKHLTSRLITITAETAREAVEKFFSRYFNDNYFPQENGEIKDSQGNVIAWSDTNYIRHDGGIFEAIELTPAEDLAEMLNSEFKENIFRAEGDRVIAEKYNYPGNDLILHIEPDGSVTAAVTGITKHFRNIFDAVNRIGCIFEAKEYEAEE